MLRDARIEALEEARIHPFQIREDQLVLRRELAVQAHLVDAREFHDRLDTDRAHPFLVKQLLGGAQRCSCAAAAAIGRRVRRAGGLLTASMPDMMTLDCVMELLDMLPTGNYDRNKLVTER